MVMARRIYSPAGKVFSLALTIAFGLIALAVSYAAFKGGLDFRSKAANPERIIRKWEFNENDLQGWSSPNPYVGRLYTENGFLKFGITSNENPSVIEHLLGKNRPSESIQFPQGAKIVMQFAVFPRLAVPAIPVPPIVQPRQGSGLCAQVVTSARNERTGECKQFGTPCDVPSGWNKVKSCDSPTVIQLPQPTISDSCTQEATAVRDSQTNECVVVATSCPPVGYKEDAPCGYPYGFFVNASYLLADKSDFEKPVQLPLTLTLDKKAKNSATQFTAKIPLPILKDTRIAAIRIEFSQLRKGSSVAVDWIHITGPVPKPTPTPSKGCYYQKVTCVRAPCDDVLVCPTQTPTVSVTPNPRRNITPTPTQNSVKNPTWCKLMRFIPGGPSSEDYKKYCPQ